MKIVFLWHFSHDKSSIIVQGSLEKEIVNLNEPPPPVK